MRYVRQKWPGARENGRDGRHGQKGQTHDDQSREFARHVKSKGGLGRIWRAAAYSRDGLVAAFRHEHAFRQELFLIVPLLLLALCLPVGWRDTALLCSSLLLILTVELLNSAIEACVDYISLARHPLAKRAKDMGSLAVLLSFFIAGMIWLSVLIP